MVSSVDFPLLLAVGLLASQKKIDCFILQHCLIYPYSCEDFSKTLKRENP